MNCSFKDCHRPVHASGLCRAHYGQRQRIKAGKRKKPMAELRPTGLVRLTVRLRPETVAELEAIGPSVPIAARTVLEDATQTDPPTLAK